MCASKILVCFYGDMLIILLKEVTTTREAPHIDSNARAPTFALVHQMNLIHLPLSPVVHHLLPL
jgi:hypothetical protein